MLEKGHTSLSVPDHMSIFDEEFPDNVSLSDLCDCGRHKRQHTHKPIIQHRGAFPKSDYMLTYEAVKNPRPRSSKRPPMTARDPRPPPMFLNTNQKDDFKNLGYVERVKPIIQVESYEPPTAPLDGLSSYAQEFTAKQSKVEPIVRQQSRRELIHREPAHFDDTTTNKQHFKRWVPQPTLTFGELPSFTGSILFPEKPKATQTTKQESYQGKWQKPVEPIKAAASSIRIEGSHTFDTTHNSTFQDIKGDHRAKPEIHKDTTPLRRRGPFYSVTQAMDDFPGYKGNQPRPPHPIDPPQPTIDLRFNNKRSFSTENRTIYRGHDVKEFPAPLSCKQADGEYKLPTVKFETETSQKRDYQPIDLKGTENPRMKIPQASMSIPVDAPFDSHTMNKEFFQDWGYQPRIRYGDFHENRPYIPPRDPFNAESVTQSTYIPKTLEMVKSMKPESKAISKEGQFYFNTVYNDEFQKKQNRMCRAQMYLIQQELKRRKRQQQQQQQPQQSKCASAPQTNSKLAAAAPNTQAAA